MSISFNPETISQQSNISNSLLGKDSATIWGRRKVIEEAIKEATRVSDSVLLADDFFKSHPELKNIKEPTRASYILGKYNTLASRMLKRLKKEKTVKEKDIEALKLLYNVIPEYQNTKYAYDFPIVPEDYQKIK